MGESTGLAEEQLRTLDRLRTVRVLKRFYLAGGSAVAYHLHHRRSVDLDLFSLDRNVDLDLVQQELVALFSGRVLSRSDAALRLLVGETMLDLVRYPYAPLATPSAGPASFPVAGLLDLATMKLAALARRGIRRDFWDLYAILATGLSLRETVRAYVDRFGLAEPDTYHLLRALTYFADAEKETAWPAGLMVETWETIKAFFRKETPLLLPSTSP